MKKTAIALLLFALPLTLAAQALKVTGIDVSENAPKSVEFPNDLNGNPCALVKVTLAADGVGFEGNVIGTPSKTDDGYEVFLTRGSKFLNVKYPGQAPMLIRFDEYTKVPVTSRSLVTISMTEPDGDIVAQLNSELDADVSPEAEQLVRDAYAMYSRGNYIDSYPMFMQAYELGHPKAAYYIGSIYSDPYSTMRKNKLARKISGVAIPELPVEASAQMAFKYYLESAEKGFVTAQFAVGECYEKGAGVKKDKEKAREWYQKAADQGHLQAFDKVGGKVKKHRTFGITTSFGNSGNVFLASKVTSSVSDLSAVINGRDDANGQQCALIKVIMPFDGVTFGGDLVGDPLFKTNEYWVYVPQGTKSITVSYPDYETLKVDFKSLGCEIIGKNTYNLYVSFPIDLLSDDDSLTGDDCYNIALAYVERRDNQYARWLAKAADKRHPESMAELGVCHLYGQGVKKDKDRGLRMLEEASKLGVGAASYHLGTYYEMQAFDRDAAQRWYDLAAEQGYELAVGKKAKSHKKNILLPF